MALFFIVLFCIFGLLVVSAIKESEPHPIFWSFVLTVIIGLVLGLVWFIISSIYVSAVKDNREKEVIKSEDLILLENEYYVRVYKDGSTIKYKYCTYNEVSGPVTHALSSKYADVQTYESPRIDTLKTVFNTVERLCLFTEIAEQTYILYAPEDNIRNELY